MAIIPEIKVNLPVKLNRGSGKVLKNYTNVNIQHRVEKIYCEGIIFFRYLSAITYRDYEVIKTEKFFTNRKRAINYWENEIGNLFYTN